VIVAPDFSEEQMALVAVQSHGADWRFVSDTNEWHQFRDGIWRLDKKRGIFTLGREICRAGAARAVAAEELSLARGLASARTRAAVVSLMANDPRIVVAHDELDANPMLLGTPAGYVDLETGRLFEADRKCLITQSTAVAPAPTGTPCPAWQNFLRTTFPLVPGKPEPDEEVIDHIQRFMGYTLTGRTDAERFTFLQGIGRNGKNVLLDTFYDIMGDYSVVMPSEALMERPVEPHRAELAALRGRRLVVANEISQNKHWNQARLMDLSGGGTISANRMRQDPIDFKFVGKLWIAGNHKPAFRSVIPAVVERLILIRFLMTFVYEHEHTEDEFRNDLTLAVRDDGLKFALKAEWPAILAWTIEGTQRWLREGFKIPQRVRDDSTQYMAEQDEPGEWITECCQRGIGEELTRVLRESWNLWRRDRGESESSEPEFRQILSDRGFTRDHKRRGSIVEGLTLNDFARTRVERARQEKRAQDQTDGASDRRW